MVRHDPNGDPVGPIDQIYVLAAVHQDGGEGIAAAYTGAGWMPMVATQERSLDKLREAAGVIAADTGRPVVLLKFTGRAVLESFDPPSN